MNKLMKKEGKYRERNKLRIYHDNNQTPSKMGTPIKVMTQHSMSSPSKEQMQERMKHLKEKQIRMRENKQITKNFE
jgi:hypothetical protein